ncbi:type II toxin-antitoxin system ParD family antitoxin [Pseudochelatococcus sp. B33]
MANVERLSITLPADMARLIRQKVEEGHYASNSEVIREAVRTWQEREQIRIAHLDTIRARIAEADTDPRPSLTEEEVERHFRRRLEKALAAKKADA